MTTHPTPEQLSSPRGTPLTTLSCAVTAPGPEVDLVLEGTAHLIRNAAQLQQVADLFPAKYPWWRPIVKDGEFYDPGDATDHRHVYSVEPAQVFAFGKESGFIATRWRP
ncbi:hypothetical protein [Kribbella catacumbae]|uniref:hypothetical protein n=1 Tax=Kribbella catacumbae TaxID=460086 RepID=UPI00035FF31B|nr:hypothetical protein [Kribbella catacumbae]